MSTPTLKSKLLGSVFALSVGLLVQTAAADTLTESSVVKDVDPPDTFTQYCAGDATCLASKDGWSAAAAANKSAFATDSDVNQLAGADKGPDNLNNANEATDRNWLNALLGNTFLTQTAAVIDRIDGPNLPGSTPGENTKTLSDYTPGFSWVYAVLKPDNYWLAVQNDGSNQISGTFNHGISHITFFTPIPGAALLFGSALAGLWACAAGEARAGLRLRDKAAARWMESGPGLSRPVALLGQVHGATAGTLTGDGADGAGAAAVAPCAGGRARRARVGQAPGDVVRPLHQEYGLRHLRGAAAQLPRVPLRLADDTELAGASAP